MHKKSENFSGREQHLFEPSGNEEHQRAAKISDESRALQNFFNSAKPYNSSKYLLYYCNACHFLLIIFFATFSVRPQTEIVISNSFYYFYTLWATKVSGRTLELEKFSSD